MPENWEQSRKAVMDALERIESRLSRLEGKVDSLVETTAELKVKSGVWGMLGGAITSATVALVALVAYLFKK